MPSQFGRYRVDELVGTGAFSTVYKATDERLGATVALKVLAENHSLDPAVRERFLTEARALRRIDSANVVRMYDLDETEGAQPYLALEYADQGTLGDRVAACRGEGWEPLAVDVLTVVRPLANALAAVHGADFVHRDLSPNNVLLRRGPGEGGSRSGLLAPGERVLLADLGLCKDLAVHSGLTAAGGTHGFRPPEQREGPAEIGFTADLWSLSALTVWLITGKRPDQLRETVGAVVAAGFPKALGTALATGLADDPGRRQPDVATWLHQVEAALDSRLREDEPSTRVPKSAAGRAGRRPVVIAAVAGLVVGLAAGPLASLIGGPATTDLGDGDVQVEQRAGDAGLAIAGPAEAAVGETVTFTAEADDVADWVWVDPLGELYAGDTVDVTPTSAGTGTVRLLGVSPDGEILDVTHRFDVSD